MISGISRKMRQNWMPALTWRIGQLHDLMIGRSWDAKDKLRSVGLGLAHLPRSECSRKDQGLARPRSWQRGCHRMRSDIPYTRKVWIECNGVSSPSVGLPLLRCNIILWQITLPYELSGEVHCGIWW